MRTICCCSRWTTTGRSASWSGRCATARRSRPAAKPRPPRWEPWLPATAATYTEAVHAVLRSFEERDRFLERVPVADPVIVLQRLAALRDMERPLVSSRLPHLRQEPRDG